MTAETSSPSQNNGMPKLRRRAFVSSSEGGVARSALATRRFLTPASLISLRTIGKFQGLLRGIGLDCGSGTGCLAIAAARVPTVERVLGLEISPANVAIARENAVTNGVSGRVDFILSDSYAPISPADRAALDQLAGRVHFVLPKVKEFVHRATWAPALPERKRLEEVFRNHVEPRVPFPEVDKVREELEHLLKARQVLFAQGSSVAQECRSITSEINRTLSTLLRNAAENARRKRDAKRNQRR